MLMVGVLSVHYARSFAIAQAQMGPKLLAVIWNSGCPLLRGFECIEIYGDTVQTFRNVHYIASACR